MVARAAGGHWSDKANRISVDYKKSDRVRLEPAECWTIEAFEGRSAKNAGCEFIGKYAGVKESLDAVRY